MAHPTTLRLNTLSTISLIHEPRVVRVRQRRLIPAKPSSRIRRTTRLRLAPKPPAANSACTRSTPQVPQGALWIVRITESPRELLVPPPPVRPPAPSPRVVPAGGAAQHPAHRGHSMIGLVHFHEFEDLPGTVPVSRANPLFTNQAVLPPKPTQLLAFRCRQAGLTTTLVPIRWPHPAAYRRL